MKRVVKDGGGEGEAVKANKQEGKVRKKMEEENRRRVTKNETITPPSVK